MGTVCWLGHGSLAFESASILVCKTNGKTADENAPFVAGSSMSGLVRDDDDLNLASIPLSRNAYAGVCESILRSLRRGVAIQALPFATNPTKCSGFW